MSNAKELDRAKVINQNFITRVQQLNFPAAKSATALNAAGISSAIFKQLFHSQFVSRHLDLIARKLKETNQSFYTIGSSGHEGNAAIAKVFGLKDIAFLHYRSGAFVVERSKQLKDKNIIKEVLLSLAASKLDPVCSGRHKVWGGVDLNIPPQTSTIASHLPKAVGAALAITMAKELKINSHLSADAVSICSFGDASVNHATAQSAFNLASRLSFVSIPLPIVFVCEDNGIGISVPTPENWIAHSIAPRMEYIACDGLNLADVFAKAKMAEKIARQQKKPVFLHMKTVRLLGHAGSDVEFQYAKEAAIVAREADDPLLHSARIAYENNILTNDEIIEFYNHIAAQVAEQAEVLANAPKLESAAEIMQAIVPQPVAQRLPPQPSATNRQQILKNIFPNVTEPRNMCQNLNLALTDILLQYPNTVIFGEDVAAKGGVYRVTADLLQRFGQRRVFDSILDEQSILGTAIGLAHNDILPIAEIQFLAYLHTAIDQIRGEAATLPFFSNGNFANPMIIRVAGLAYQQGFGGHFHNDNAIGFLREIPGIIIACPANGADAAKMLRTAVQLAYIERRVVVFLEPIALYMTKDLHTKGDGLWAFPYPDVNETIALGELGIYGESQDTVIFTYANGLHLSLQAQKILAEQYNIIVRVIDLRWLAPLNEEQILKQANNASQIIVVDECRQTGGVGEQIITLLAEKCRHQPLIKRVAAKDCFIPLGPAFKQVLPSVDNIIAAVAAATSIPKLLQNAN